MSTHTVASGLAVEPAATVRSLEDVTAHTSAAVEWLPVVLLVGLGVLLRAIGLDSGLWQDEIYALVEMMRPPLRQILTSYPADTHHPLYSALAHVSIALLGESAWTARLPALLFGVATIPALYLLARHIGSRREALLACLLLTVSYHHVWFSQNARGYTALALFATLCAWALLRGIEEQRARWFVLYACLIGLAAFTHLTIVFMAVGHALLCAWLLFGPRGHRRISDWRLPFIAFGGGALLTVLLYLPMIGDVFWWYVHRPSNLLGVSTPAWALLEGIRVLALGIGVHPLVLLAAGAVFMAGVVSLWRQNPVIVWVFALPAGATLAGAVLARGTLYPRFFFFMAALLILVAVRGAVVSGGWLAARLRLSGMTQRRAGELLALALVIASARSLPYNYAYPKQDFAGAIRYVESGRGAGEPVLVAGAHYAYSTYYGLDWEPLSDVAQLRARQAAGGTMWLLYMQPRYIEKNAPGLVAAIEEVCLDRRNFHGTVGGSDIMVCRTAPGTQ